MDRKLRLGIVGTGVIADFMAAYMIFHKDIEIVSVSSRNLEKAEKFSQRYFIPNYCDDYHQFINYELDAVYIATPPQTHSELAIYFLEKGINVLCEKPMTYDVGLYEKVFDTAQKSKKLFMLNLVTAYLPIVKDVKDIINKHEKINHISLSIGTNHKADNSFLFENMEYGGAFCDMSCYVFYFLRILLSNQFKEFDVKSLFYSAGIDIQTDLSLEYDDKICADCHIFISSEDMACDAYIHCGDTVIKIGNFARGGSIEIEREGLLYKPKYSMRGFEYMLDELVYCCRNHCIESSKLPFSLIRAITQDTMKIKPLIKGR